MVKVDNVKKVENVQKKEEIKDMESQEKKEALTKQNIRFLFFSICSLITYILVIWKLFRKEEFLVSWILFCILFIELIFLSIDIRGVKKRIMRWGLIILGILSCLLVPYPVFQNCPHRLHLNSHKQGQFWQDQ